MKKLQMHFHRVYKIIENFLLILYIDNYHHFSLITSNPNNKFRKNVLPAGKQAFYYIIHKVEIDLKLFIWDRLMDENASLLHISTLQFVTLCFIITKSALHYLFINCHCEMCQRDQCLEWQWKQFHNEVEENR